MTGAALPLLAVAAGWGWSCLLAARSHGASRIVSAVVLAIVATGGWLTLLDLLGVHWTPPVMAAGLLPGLFLAIWPWLWRLRNPDGGSGRGEPLQPPSPWAIVAMLGVGARAAAVAAVPAFGWDFRYIWGLKARVFAMAGAHDLRWLAEPVHVFTHPDYPPLWPDLLAAGCVTGTPAGQVAAWWGALLAAGLGAACWRLARPAGRPIAALAALAGTWFPTLLAPDISHSGSAEPLAAFLFAAALTAAALLRRTTGSTVVLATALGALAVTKREGSVLALLLLPGLLPHVEKRRRPLVVAATVVPLFLWQLAVTVSGIPRLALNIDAARMLSRFTALPATACSILTPVLLLEIILVGVILTAPHFSGARPLKLVLILWLAAVGLAYLTSLRGLHWQMETSLARVLAIPLPGALALALGGGLFPTVDSRLPGQHNASSATPGRKEDA